MAYLPTSPVASLATKNDLAALRSEVTDLRTELKGEISLLSQRMDRMQLTLLGGFSSMIVALMVAVVFG